MNSCKGNIEKETKVKIIPDKHVELILEFTHEDILKELANYSKLENDSIISLFEQALSNTNLENNNFVEEFYMNYLNLGGNPISLFAKNVDYLKGSSFVTQDEAIDLIKREIYINLEDNCKIIRTRLERIGIEGFEINNTEKLGRIQIKMPMVDDLDRVIRLLQSKGNLEFYETYKYHEVVDSLKNLSNYAISISNDTTKSLMTMLGNINDKFYCEVGHVLVSDTAAVNKIINNKIAKEFLPYNLKLHWICSSTGHQDQQSNSITLIAIKTDIDYSPCLTGEVITYAEPYEYKEGGFLVKMFMNNEGAKRWSRITEENIGLPIAIVIDDQVYSYPKISEKFDAGVCEISGIPTAEKAADLANIIESGHMRGRPAIVSKKVINN